MLPILPRELLWREVESMDEFFEMEPVNLEFYEVFIKLRNEPFSVSQDAVKVFNEAYYQLTRMVYEHPMPTDLKKYAADIKTNLGWSYSDTLVMSMVYFLDALRNNKEYPLNKFFLQKVKEAYGGPMYWLPFKQRTERLKRKRTRLEYDFRPRPFPPSYFKTVYVNWNAITQRDDLSCIKHVLNLWDRIEDKQEIANMILEGMCIGGLNHPQGMECNQVRRFLNNYFETRKRETSYNKTLFEADKYESEKNLEQIEHERIALRKHIAEQEAEIARLKTLMDAKKNEGKERRLTLVQIVDYCKGSVSWHDVKPIVAMLYSLIDESTEEDRELIKSIDAEFLRRAMGHVIINNPQFCGPMYDITGNQSVNIGGENGK